MSETRREEVLGRFEQAIVEQNQKLDESFAKLIGAIRLISGTVTNASSSGHLQQQRPMTPETVYPSSEVVHGHRSGINSTYSAVTRLSKLDFHRFSGDREREWLFKLEQFFSLNFTPEELKVRIASIHLDGAAPKWHQSLFESDFGDKLLSDWKTYKLLLQEHFAEVLEDPIAELKQLKETNGIEEYHKKFELLRTRVNLTENYLVRAYLDGLQPDTRENVQLFQPQTVNKCFLVGRLYEQAHREVLIIRKDGEDYEKRAQPLSVPSRFAGPFLSNFQVDHFSHKDIESSEEKQSIQQEIFVEVDGLVKQHELNCGRDFVLAMDHGGSSPYAKLETESFLEPTSLSELELESTESKMETNYVAQPQVSIFVMESSHRHKLLGNFDMHMVIEDQQPVVTVALSPLFNDFNLEVAEFCEQSTCVKSHKRETRVTPKSWMFKYKRDNKKLHIPTMSKNVRMLVFRKMEAEEMFQPLVADGFHEGPLEMDIQESEVAITEVLRRVMMLFQNSIVHHQPTVNEQDKEHHIMCLYKSRDWWSGIAQVRKPATSIFLYEKIIMVNEWLVYISLVIQQVMRCQKIKFSKRWWFKYKFEEEGLTRLSSSNWCMTYYFAVWHCWNSKIMVYVAMSGDHWFWIVPVRKSATSSFLLLLYDHRMGVPSILSFCLLKELNQDRHELCSENKGCLDCFHALVLMQGITNSSFSEEEGMKEEADSVKVNKVKLEIQTCYLKSALIEAKMMGTNTKSLCNEESVYILEDLSAAILEKNQSQIYCGIDCDDFQCDVFRFWEFTAFDKIPLGRTVLTKGRKKMFYKSRRSKFKHRVASRGLPSGFEIWFWRLVIYKLGGKAKTFTAMCQCVDQLVKMESAKDVTQSQTFDTGIGLESQETLRSLFQVELLQWFSPNGFMTLWR